MAEPEPKPEAEAEPKYFPITAEPEYFPSSESEYPPTAEPQVDLSSVSKAWWIAFKFHWTFFAICFALLVLYNGYQLYKTIFRKGQMANRSYVSIVQTLVIVLGFTRALALCISPYELISNTPKPVPFVIPRLLFGFGFPCLFSGFTFVHKIFLDVSKVQVISRNALGNKLVAVVLVIHFIAFVASEIITSYVKGTGFLLLICALYYFMGCLGIALSLLFSGTRLLQKTRKIQASLTEYKQTGKPKNSEPYGTGKNRTSEATTKVMRITAFTAIFGILCALLYIYTLVWIIRVTIGDKSSPAPWIWLIVNTFLRLFELFLASTMSYAVGSTYQRNTHTRILISRCDAGSTVTTPP